LVISCFMKSFASPNSKRFGSDEYETPWGSAYVGQFCAGELESDEKVLGGY
jgi:hypothetical protein